jgi:DNA-binding protein H-NS
LGEHNDKHAVFSANAGNRMETDGTQLTLRYELEFRMKPDKDTLSVWLQKESLVGETRDGQERRQERDPKNNLNTFQNVLNSVKARLEQPADSSGA